MKQESYSKAEIGKRLARIRGEMNMSQPKFAELAEISANFLSQVENGGKGISIDTLVKISLISGYSIEYIVFGRTNDDPISHDSLAELKRRLHGAMEILDREN